MNELEKLAGFGKVGLSYEQEASEGEIHRPHDETFAEKNIDTSAEKQMEASDRPVSAGVGSNYSDFMAQWRKKLFTDDTNAANTSGSNGPPDVV
jgi:hypothetical protein